MTSQQAKGEYLRRWGTSKCARMAGETWRIFTTSLANASLTVIAGERYAPDSSIGSMQIRIAANCLLPRTYSLYDVILHSWETAVITLLYIENRNLYIRYLIICVVDTLVLVWIVFIDCCCSFLRRLWISNSNSALLILTWSCDTIMRDNHWLRGSASPVLTATGFVNGRGQFSTPTESTPLDRSPKNLLLVITSATPTAVPNLVQIRPRGASGQMGEI